LNKGQIECTAIALGQRRYKSGAIALDQLQLSCQLIVISCTCFHVALSSNAHSNDIEVRFQEVVNKVLFKLSKVWMKVFFYTLLSLALICKVKLVFRHNAEYRATLNLLNQDGVEAVCYFKYVDEMV